MNNHGLSGSWVRTNIPNFLQYKSLKKEHAKSDIPKQPKTPYEEIEHAFLTTDRLTQEETIQLNQEKSNLRDLMCYLLVALKLCDQAPGSLFSSSCYYELKLDLEGITRYLNIYTPSLSNITDIAEKILVICTHQNSWLGKGYTNSAKTVLEQILGAKADPKYLEEIETWLKSLIGNESSPAKTPFINASKVAAAYVICFGHDLTKASLGNITDEHVFQYILRESNAHQLTFGRIQILYLCKANFREFNYLFLPKFNFEKLVAPGIKFVESSLEFSSFYRADLEAADFSGAILTETSFRRAILSKVNFSGAKLYKANLSITDLTGAKLTDTHLDEVNLSEAKLSGVDLSSIKLSPISSNSDLKIIDFTSADLSQANLSNLDLRGAKFTSANLSGANLSGSNLSGLDLKGVNLTGANLRGAKLIKTDLSYLDLYQVNLSQADLTKAELTGTTLEKADLTNATLDQANLSMTNLKGAILTQAKLNKATLTETDLSQADLTQAEAEEASFLITKLDKANFTQAKLNKAIIHESQMIETNFSHAQLAKADVKNSISLKVNFSSTNLIGARFIDVVLNQADLTEADCSNSMFEQVRLDKAQLSGADFTDAIFSGDLSLISLKSLQAQTQYQIEGTIKAIESVSQEYLQLKSSLFQQINQEVGEPLSFQLSTAIPHRVQSW
jgi:uncharacterized protein YjbI with pentapeptide repeats